MFPGESEIDQLYVIQKIIGPLPPEQMHLFNSNPRFRGLKFPTEIKPLSLKQKYHTNLPADLLNFLEVTLRLESRKRLTIDQCIKHGAFKTGKAELMETANEKEETIEDSWKEIQFENPSVNNNDKPSQNVQKFGKKSKQEVDGSFLEQVAKQEVQTEAPRRCKLDNKQEVLMEQSSDILHTEGPKQQFDSISKRDNRLVKPLEASISKQPQLVKSVDHKKMINPSEPRSNMNSISKQYGKYKQNTHSVYTNSMISAGNMGWSQQPVHGGYAVTTGQRAAVLQKDFTGQQYPFFGQVHYSGRVFP